MPSTSHMPHATAGWRTRRLTSRRISPQSTWQPSSRAVATTSLRCRNSWKKAMPWASAPWAPMSTILCRSSASMPTETSVSDFPALRVSAKMPYAASLRNAPQTENSRMSTTSSNASTSTPATARTSNASSRLGPSTASAPSAANSSSSPTSAMSPSSKR